MKKLLTFLAFLYAFSPLYAQLIEGNPCTATCIDPSGKITGRQPNQNNVSPNVNIPCGAGTSEDNPSWWIVRPTGNSLTFSFTTSNCVPNSTGVIGTEMTLWEGDACGSVTAIECVTGTSGTLTTAVTPCKVYYLQLDGLNECQCNVTLTYDPNQILKTVPKPVITGPKSACLGATIKLCASLPSLPGCKTESGYTWRVDPSGSATIMPISGETDCANIKVNSVPPGGKIKICAKPKFNGKCPPTAQEECFEIEVINLKPATCDVKICPEERPYEYDIRKCIKTTNPVFNDSITPNSYIINFPPGTTKQQKINYAIAQNGCQGDITLNISVLDNKPTLIPPVMLCEKDTAIVQEQTFTCADAGPAIKKFQKLGSPKPQRCDSTFEVLVQCIKITPVITGAINLGCDAKTTTLSADVLSLTLPNSINLTTYTGVGKRTYQWYKNDKLIAGATLPTLEVTEAGKYSLLLEYTYEITMTINGTQGKWSKSCSKSTSVEIKDISNSVKAVASSNSPVCEGKTAMLVASGGTSYLWSGPDNFSSTLANPTIPNVQAKNAGLYSVEVTNADNCKGIAKTNLVVENCISSKDVVNKNVQIYPNPFTQQLNIDADEIMDKVIIYNSLGQVIVEQTCQNNKIVLDVSALPSAHYNLKIKWANGKNSEYRVLKQ